MWLHCDSLGYLKLPAPPAHATMSTVVYTTPILFERLPEIMFLEARVSSMAKSPIQTPLGLQSKY